MRDDMRRRLRQLGVVKGVRELATLPPHHRVAIEDLVPGRFRTTSHGQCFIVEMAYPLEHLHGSIPLSAFLGLSPESAAQVAGDEALAGADLRRTCFLDTETTGLSGGTGTMAFVVGLGFFGGESFHLHQYFLRDPGDEPAMIETLSEELPNFEVLVSFNGRAFDVPILENRFILARIPPPTTGIPHLDLLLPARKLWQYHLSSRALGAIEREVLDVLREQDDVPGGIIPYLYRDYLRTGDAREMKRVLYHNAVDVLSLVTLAARLCRTFADPWSEAGLSSAEFYGLGRWHANEGRPAEAERAYRAALRTAGPGRGEQAHHVPHPGPNAGDSPTPDLRARVLCDLAYLLKRTDRRGEAFAYWQQLVLETPPDAPHHILAHVELTKFLEWHVGDLSLAAEWTRSALRRVENWPPGPHRDSELAELRHRLARLERKMGAPRPPSPPAQGPGPAAQDSESREAS